METTCFTISTSHGVADELTIILLELKNSMNRGNEPINCKPQSSLILNFYG
jgi:hypothetical protein